MSTTTGFPVKSIVVHLSGGKIDGSIPGPLRSLCTFQVLEMAKVNWSASFSVVRYNALFDGQ